MIEMLLGTFGFLTSLAFLTGLVTMLGVAFLTITCVALLLGAYHFLGLPYSALPPQKRTISAGITTGLWIMPYESLSFTVTTEGNGSGPVTSVAQPLITATGQPLLVTDLWVGVSSGSSGVEMVPVSLPSIPKTP